MYSIVIPIKVYSNNKDNYTNNYVLFREVGLKSYEKFLDPQKIEIIYIICPREETKIMQETISNLNSILPYKIIADEELVTDINNCGTGWYKQQIIKLSVSEIIKTKYYLVLDSDMYLNQPFCYSNLFHEDKLKYSSEPWQTENGHEFSTNSNWWINSCKILDYDINKLQVNDLMSVTPQVLLTEIVQTLICHIRIADNDWQQFLCKNMFTEFTLYWIYILMNNYKDLYTNQGYPLWNHNLKTNVLTYGCDRKQVRNSFTSSSSYFSVIQGYIQQDISPLITECIIQLDKHYDAVFLTASMLIPNRHQSYHWSERLQQTTDTLNSIKKYVPKSFCILIEGSVIPEHAKKEYMKHYDHIIELGDNEEILPFVNHPHNIGHGEMKLLEKGIDFVIANILDKFKVDYIFKLGARYVLNNNFSCKNFDNNKYGFRAHIDDSIKTKVFTTGLYGIPTQKLEEFRRILIDGQDILTTKCPMIERLFVDMIPEENIHLVETLGLEGNLSYNKHFFSV